MSDIVYGLWLGGQDPPGWWIDATGTPFHSVHRGVVVAMQAEKKEENDHWAAPMAVEVIGPDGLPMSKDMLALLGRMGGTYAAQYAAFTQAGSKE